MRKIKNKFIALLMVFTSILSFLPAQFGGQVANAAVVGADATAIQIIPIGSTTPLATRQNTGSQQVIYTDPVYEKNGYTLTINDVRVKQDDLVQQALDKNQSTSGIIDQKVDIVSINDFDLVKDSAILQSIGISVEDYSDAKTKKIGKKITGLPLGVNRITYKITITTCDVTYTQEQYDPITKVKIADEKAEPKTDVINYNEEEVTLEHGTGFAGGKIDPMTVKAYVGNSASFDDNDNLSDVDAQNNKFPFLYSTDAEPDKNMPLRYTFNVPDSTSKLKYIMNFTNGISLDGAKIYKNGKLADKEYTASGTKLSGYLTNLSQDNDLIIIQLNPDRNNNDVQKTYAIEIKYNTLNYTDDYSLKDSGITKRWFNDDDTVSAYIGKKFIITNDKSTGFPIYTGDIHIDSRAKEVSINPILAVDKDTVAYSVTNNYKDTSGGITKTIKASLSGGDGKNYVDFQKGAYSNQIQIDVYKGKDGNISDASTVLARYILNVDVKKDNQSTMNLQFIGTPEPYLRQPGVSDSVLTFNQSRVTYDLCFGNISTDKVANPVEINYTGTQSNRNEYIKVFYATNKDSNSYTEFQESKDNAYDADQSSSNYLKRNSSITVDLKDYEKIYIQTYYDKFEKKKVTVNGVETEQDVLVGSYPAGDKYVFYLPQNYKSSNNTPPEENSSDASLSSLNIKGYTLKDTDGNEGFSSDKLAYTTTVAKGEISEQLIVKPTNKDVSSIVATIDGSTDTYDLVSGEETDIPLKSNGTTTVKIVVTAQDGVTTKTYSVVIKNNTKSSSADLKNVILSTGDYNFDPKEDPTEVRVDQDITSIQVTPIPVESKSTITVNGQEYSDNAVKVSLKGSQKTEIEIVVVSEDGSESKTYTLKVYRVDVSDWDGNSGDGSQYDQDQYYDEYNDCWVDTRKYEEWGTVNGKAVYFDKNHRQVKDAWITTGGKLYYLNNVGYRASGWKIDQANGKTYYLDPTTGEMRTGWMNLSNSWYYLDLKGIMHKGWLSLNGKWYYFTQNGQMVANQSMYIDDGTYTFGQDGAVIF